MIGTLLGLAVVLLAYFMGAIPTGLIVARLRGVDIQAAGSGNIGATNVLRSVGPWSAAGRHAHRSAEGRRGRDGAHPARPRSLVGGRARALAAVLGNGFNVFLRFRGGKGVATTLGVFVVIDPWVTLTGVLIFALALVFGRMVSLASLVAVCSAPDHARRPRRRRPRRRCSPSRSRCSRRGATATTSRAWPPAPSGGSGRPRPRLTPTARRSSGAPRRLRPGRPRRGGGRRAASAGPAPARPRPRRRRQRERGRHLAQPPPRQQQRDHRHQVEERRDDRRRRARSATANSV